MRHMNNSLREKELFKARRDLNKRGFEHVQLLWCTPGKVSLRLILRARSARVFVMSGRDPALSGFRWSAVRLAPMTQARVIRG